VAAGNRRRKGKAAAPIITENLIMASEQAGIPGTPYGAQDLIAAVLAGGTGYARTNGGERPAAVRSVSLRAAIGLLCLSLLLLPGCASMGPPTVARDRFDYVTAVSESWKRQMLLNLLKVRYADAPVFMDIASVINSYELTGDVSLNGQLAQIGRGDQFASLGVTGRYSDKPTITYQPLAGEKFTRSLMLPLPIPGILFLMQSGYPADLVLRICVDSVNGLQNAYGGPGRPQAGDPKFRELITAVREAQAAGGMGLRMKSATNRQAMVMFLRPSTDEAIAEPVRKIRELLGLNATAREFNVVYGNYPENDTEVAILSRSILQLLIDLASHIDVPAVDLAAGSVSGLQRTPEQERMFPTLLSVRCGPSAPEDAHVSVQYRKQWFWIEDGDRQSKQIFNFMMFMFSLTDTGTELATPVVTIPAR
jgi:hypothetical protein